MDRSELANIALTVQESLEIPEPEWLRLSKELQGEARVTVRKKAAIQFRSSMQPVRKTSHSFGAAVA